jgi:hypothetical protein
MDDSQSTAKAAAWMVASALLILAISVSGQIIARVVDVFQIMEMRSVIAFSHPVAAGSSRGRNSDNPNQLLT